jgi:hypothetical protein
MSRPRPRPRLHPSSPGLPIWCKELQRHARHHMQIGKPGELGRSLGRGLGRRLRQ